MLLVWRKRWKIMKPVHCYHAKNVRRPAYATAADKTIALVFTEMWQVGEGISVTWWGRPSCLHVTTKHSKARCWTHWDVVQCRRTETDAT